MSDPVATAPESVPVPVAAPPALSAGPEASRGARLGRLGAVVLLLAVTAGGGYLLYHFVLRPADTGPEHWRLAQEAIDKRDFPTAIKHLNQCLEVWPLNARTNFVLARTYRRQGDFKEWDNYLNRAEALQWPADQIKLERQLQQAQTGDIWPVDQALVETLNAYTEHKPEEEVIILEALVEGYVDNDRMDDVISLTKKWMQRHPDDWLAYYYNGKAHLTMQMGQFNTPVSDFKRVLELRKDDEATRLLLANAYMKNGEYQEGLEQFEMYLETHPEDLDALYGKGWCLYNLARNAEAREVVDQMFKVKGGNENPQTYGLLMHVEKADNNPRKALQAVDNALKYGPKDLTLAATKVQFMRYLKMTKEADAFEAQQKKEISGKEEALNKKINQIRDNLANAELRYEAGELSLELGRDAEAAHWFETALRVNPNHLKTWERLARYWEEKRDREKNAEKKQELTTTAQKYRKRADELKKNPVPTPEPKGTKTR